MVFELPGDRTFMNFTNLNKLSDIGFNPSEIKDEACAEFVWTTVETKTKRIFVNVMLIDPYYDNVQISFFESSSFFEQKKMSPKIKD